MILSITLGLKPFTPPAGVARMNSADKTKVHVVIKPTHVPGANMLETRRKNRELVLKFIRQRKISSNKLVEKTGICRTSVSNITNLLMIEGLIDCDKSERPWRYSATKKGKA